jgi:hypothetical protein
LLLFFPATAQNPPCESLSVKVLNKNISKIGLKSYWLVEMAVPHPLYCAHLKTSFWKTHHITIFLFEKLLMYYKSMVWKKVKLAKYFTKNFLVRCWCRKTKLWMKKIFFSSKIRFLLMCERIGKRLRDAVSEKAFWILCIYVYIICILYTGTRVVKNTSIVIFCFVIKIY